MGTITQTIFDVVCIGGCVICASLYSLYFMRKMHKMKRRSREKADGEEVESGD